MFQNWVSYIKQIRPVFIPLKIRSCMGLGGVFFHGACWDTCKSSLLSFSFAALSTMFRGGIAKSYYKSGSVCLFFLQWPTCFRRSPILLRLYMKQDLLQLQYCRESISPRSKFCITTLSSISKRRPFLVWLTSELSASGLIMFKFLFNFLFISRSTITGLCGYTILKQKRLQYIRHGLYIFHFFRRCFECSYCSFCTPVDCRVIRCWFDVFHATGFNKKLKLLTSIHWPII